MARDAKARKAADGAPELVETTPEPVGTKPRPAKAKAAAPDAESTEVGAA